MQVSKRVRRASLGGQVGGANYFCSSWA